MRKLGLITLFLLLFSSAFSFYNATSTNNNSQSKSFRIELNSILISDVPSNIHIQILDPVLLNQDSIWVEMNGSTKWMKVQNGKIDIPYVFQGKNQIQISLGEQNQSILYSAIPLWLSVLPPLIAISIALLFKEVFSALFIGLFSGTLIIYGYQDVSLFAAFFKAIFAVADTYIIQSLTDKGHISIIVFSMLIGGMVNLITKNGGMHGVVSKLSRFANSPRSGQFITWLLGVLIFFDDYANTLVVGNTMRPVTDRLKISREKLAYLVDSTAAPVASIAMITTWIGIELSYIQSATVQIGISEKPYSIFIHSLPTRFYAFFTLFFILMLIILKKDFGPMYKAEKKARKASSVTKTQSEKTTDAEIEISEDTPRRWYNAGIPVLVVILGTFAGLIYTGWDSEVWNDTHIGFATKLSHIIGESDSYLALLWSSITSVLVAAGLSIGQRILNLKDTVEALISGFKTMLTAILILIMAWALADITKDLHTADFISHLLVSIQLPPQFLPAFTFILSAVIAFSTGSSWGTMAILYPLILPASWTLCHAAGMSDSESMNIFYIIVSAILAGSVLGDHSSPISDTTILSSLASSCNHIEHVRTQFPYAITVGAVSIVFGLLPAAYGISSWILVPIGFVILFLIVRFFGRTT